ncbi:hypothetical protein ACRQ5Q_16665 [Bradyrhizobium sp. PMVTL-01]|uniref:hypothetical protein n=1 Tax=Bradyrhizobium sp. PMVTL-01 TaxID=3434999 RepID=UPI003F6EACEC
MTHSGGKPHNVGDKGQRYEVLANGYPTDQDDNVIGWTETLDGAERMMSAILKAPGCTSASIFDRQEKVGVIKLYAEGSCDD